MARTIFENIIIERYDNATAFGFCKYTSIRFFEILHFKKGNGTIKINGNTSSYGSNSFFVLIYMNGLTFGCCLPIFTF